MQIACPLYRRLRESELNREIKRFLCCRWVRERLLSQRWARRRQDVLLLLRRFSPSLLAQFCAQAAEIVHGTFVTLRPFARLLNLHQQISMKNRLDCIPPNTCFDLFAESEIVYRCIPPSMVLLTTSVFPLFWIACSKMPEINNWSFIIFTSIFVSLDILK